MSEAASRGSAPVHGALDGRGLRVAVVASRWNELIVERLVAGATSTLARLGVDPDTVDVAWVPGAFELPLVAQRLAGSGRYDAVITLGAVIRGATGHYELVAGNCAAGIARVALDTGVPVVFGVLTTETIEQALERAGTKAGNKGSESAAVAVEMADLLRRLPSRPVTGAGLGPSSGAGAGPSSAGAGDGPALSPGARAGA